MPSLLTDCQIPFEILPDYDNGAEETLEVAMDHFKRKSSPFCLLVRKRTFKMYKTKGHIKGSSELKLKREDVINTILQNTNKWSSFIATTGFTSRELFEIRAAKKEDHSKDFLTVGCMGHASSIALGLAVGKPSRDFYVIDGDGGSLMHMGGYATIGKMKPKNLKHILINNGCHESTGKQPTGGFNIDWCKFAKSCGYTTVLAASRREELEKCLVKMKDSEGPIFLEVKVTVGARKNLGRPNSTPIQNKKAFMNFLSQ